jgi:regulator of replication initiation timing
MRVRDALEMAPTFHSRALKMATPRPAGPLFHFQEARAFRNPFIGIELALDKRLKENSELFMGSSDRKQDILLDALEDVASLNLGYSGTIRRIVAIWRRSDRPPSAPAEPPRQAEIDRMAGDAEGFRETFQLRTERLEKLKSQVAERSAEVDDLRTELDRLRRRLYVESDVFSPERESSDLMRALQDSYDRMFTPRAEPLAAECECIMRENVRLRKELAQMKCEIRSAKQITKRLAYATTRKFV